MGRSNEEIAHYKKIIDLASAQAKIGIWECDLATSQLRWSDGVFDLFEIPRDAAVTRDQAVTFYSAESREAMEAARARAIRERTGFTLDARITTAKGNQRWMRLTANVECENGEAARLFGMKQDITTERELLDRLRRLAETDPLTGLANRGVLQARLDASKGEYAVPDALLLVDLDGFKQINDTFGHSAGDACLKEVAARLRRACDATSLIARLGGDEFAIVLAEGLTRQAIEDCVTSLVETLSQPMEWNGCRLAMSASIGVTIPEAGRAADAMPLLQAADLALYAAKAAGRNTWRIFIPPTTEAIEMGTAALPKAIPECQFDLFEAKVGRRSARTSSILRSSDKDRRERGRYRPSVNDPCC